MLMLPGVADSSLQLRWTSEMRNCSLPIRPIISIRTCRTGGHHPLHCRLVFPMQTRFFRDIPEQGLQGFQKNGCFLPFRKVPFFITSPLYALSLTDGGLVV